jgi:soluble lytic murein transglycosylase-like protein
MWGQPSASTSLFKAGIGITAVESRVRQIETLAAALQAQVNGLDARPPSNKAFLNYLQREAQQAQASRGAHGLGAGQQAQPDSSIQSPFVVPHTPYATPGDVQRVDVPAAPRGTLEPQVGYDAKRLLQLQGQPVTNLQQPLFTELLGGPEVDRPALGREGFLPMIAHLSEQHQVDKELIMALIQQESGFSPTARSAVGARGLMQLMPATAAQLGVNPDDPQQNLEGGIRYLKQQLDKYNGNVPLALAAYNAGPGAVDKYGGIPPYKETQQYVRNILANYLKAKASAQGVGIGPPG